MIYINFEIQIISNTGGIDNTVPVCKGIFVLVLLVDIQLSQMCRIFTLKSYFGVLYFVTE